MPKAHRQAVWMLPLICAHTPHPLYLLLPVVKSFPPKGCDPSLGFLLLSCCRFQKDLWEVWDERKAERKSSECSFWWAGWDWQCWRTKHCWHLQLSIPGRESQELLSSSHSAVTSPQCCPSPVWVTPAGKGHRTAHGDGSDEFLLPRGHSQNSVPLWSTHWH